MIKRPIPHYAHILDTLGVIAKYTPKTRQAFMNDPNAQDATLMRLQDIGEQLVHIRNQFPESWEANAIDDWYKMIGLRNIISHGYREIDLSIIWVVVSKKLTDFNKSIEGAK